MIAIPRSKRYTELDNAVRQAEQEFDKDCTSYDTWKVLRDAKNALWTFIFTLNNNY